MNGRVYDVDTARFLSADPNIFHPFNPQNFNRYSYVMNNPLMYTDPSGFDVFSQDDYENGYHLDDPHEAGKSHVNNDSSTNNYSQSEKDKITANKAAAAREKAALAAAKKAADDLKNKKDKEAAAKKGQTTIITKAVDFAKDLISNPNVRTASKIAGAPVNAAINTMNVATAKDSVREALGVVGGILGTIDSIGLGTAIGAAIGSVTGTEIANEIYDSITK